MGRVPGHSKLGAKLQSHVKKLFECCDIPLRECAGSGNQHRSDSDLTNRTLQIECKARTLPDGINMPNKADWKKLKGEASGANRMPLLITSGREDIERGDVLVTLKLHTLLYLMRGVSNADW